MPIDPTGTSPQAVPAAPTMETVDMRCRNSSCGSSTAYVIPIPNQPSQRVYRCTVCHRTFGLNVGGHIDV